MESCFENQYIHDKAFFNEFYAYFFYKRPLLIVFNIFFLFVFICRIIAFFAFHVPVEEYSIFYIMPVLVWTVTAIRFFRSRNYVLKQEMELNDGKPYEVCISMTNEGFDLQRTGNESVNHIDFSKIKKVIKTKSLYILLTGAKLGIVFKKDSFIKGTEVEFLQFLREKGLKC